MLGRKSALVYANRIMSALTGAIGLFFIARFMENPTYNYGLVSFGFSFVSIFTIISTFFGKAHIKRVSEKQDKGECMGTFLSLNTLATAVMVIIIFISLHIWQSVLGGGFQSKLHKDVIYIFIAFFAIRSLVAITKTTLNAEQKFAKKEIMNFADQSVPTIFIIYVAISGGGALELALTYIVGALLTALIAVYFLIDYKIKMPSVEMIKSYWQFGLPSFLNNLFNKLGNKVDIVLVQLFWSSVNVGYYTAARRLSMAVTGISWAVTTVLFPEISSLHSEGKIEQIRNTVKGSARYIGMFVIPVITFMLFFPREMIHILLSNDFLPAAPVIRILAIYSFLMAFFSPVMNTIPGIDKPKVYAMIGVLANGINIGLNIVLIPDSLFGIPLFGMKEIGAAIATLVSALVISILSYYFVDKYIGIGLPKGVILQMGSAVSAGMIIYAVHTYVLPISRIYHLVSYSLGLFGIYISILFLIGGFTKHDWDYMMESMHPGEMGKYIKDELRGKDD